MPQKVNLSDKYAKERVTPKATGAVIDPRLPRNAPDLRDPRQWKRDPKDVDENGNPGDEPPFLDAEDEDILDRIWDEAGRAKRNAR